MGCCCSSPKDDYRKFLQKSTLFISLLRNKPEDWQAFFKICELQTISLSNHLTIHPQLKFFIVVGGEVHATILSPGCHKVSTVQVFEPGDIIPLFFDEFKSTDSRSLLFGEKDEIKMSFNFRSNKQHAAVLSVGGDALARFLSQRPYLINFKNLVNLRLKDLLKTSLVAIGSEVIFELPNYLTIYSYKSNSYNLLIYNLI